MPFGSELENIAFALAPALKFAVESLNYWSELSRLFFLKAELNIVA